MYAAEALASGKMKQEDFTTFAQTEAGRGDKLAALPPVLYRQLIGTYVLGTNFITRGKGPFGDKFPAADMKRLYKDGPTSSSRSSIPSATGSGATSLSRFRWARRGSSWARAGRAQRTAPSAS
jgi:hypothetical protein